MAKQKLSWKISKKCPGICFSENSGHPDLGIYLHENF